MLKKKAKLISMLMTLSLLSVAMVGCGGKDEPAPTVSEETIPEDDGRGDVIDDANPLEAVVEDVDDELEAQPLGATGYDTNGEIAFTIYNNSAYDIYSAYVGSTTVPVPGAQGVIDYLLLEGFSHVSEIDSIANMELLIRGVSFYICVGLCGIITLIGYFKKPKELN